jgi:hypothetical protein
MAEVVIPVWWKAQEIPLTETSFPMVKKYFHQVLPKGSLTSCVYIVRLSAPYSFVYGEDCEVESPLIYVGSGNLKQRWKSHTKWLQTLGLTLPGGRYELWFCQPKRKGPEAGKFYKDVEADILQWFNKNQKVGYLPFANKKLEKPKGKNSYEKNFFERLVQTDSRYHWAIYPRTNPLWNTYSKGGGKAA